MHFLRSVLSGASEQDRWVYSESSLKGSGAQQESPSLVKYARALHKLTLKLLVANDGHNKVISKQSLSAGWELQKAVGGFSLELDDDGFIFYNTELRPDIVEPIRGIPGRPPLDRYP